MFWMSFKKPNKTKQQSQNHNMLSAVIFLYFKGHRSDASGKGMSLQDKRQQVKGQTKVNDF